MQQPGLIDRVWGEVQRGCHAGRPHVGLLLKTIMDDLTGQAILEQHLGDLLRHPQTALMSGFSLEQIVSTMSQYVSPQMLERINDALVKA